jgi:aminopeptidase
MFTKGQLEKYANVLLWALETARKERYKKNDTVLIRFDLSAVPLAECLHAGLMERGMNLVLRVGLTPAMETQFYEKASHQQLQFIGPWETELCRHLNGGIYVQGPASLTHLKDVDAAKIGKALVARKSLRDALRNREERGLYGWTLCTFPTQELAQNAGLSVKQYTQQVVRACYLDKKEPIQEWESVYREAQTIKDWLSRMDAVRYHIQSDHVDLLIQRGERRKWVGISGHNIPSFEIFFSPDCRGTKGVYYADQPSYRSGNYVQGVGLVFERGSVKETRVRKGRTFVEHQLGMDAGARRVGEFSLTDRRFSRINRFMANTLYDENYGGRFGNCHLALGSSYTDTYAGDPAKLTKQAKQKLGFNESALHWDLVNTEKKTVTAHLKNGKRTVIYEHGLFQY